MPVNILKSIGSFLGPRNNKFIFAAKVKKIILDGSQEGEPTDLTSAEKWGGYDAVGLIFYNKIQKLPKTSKETNLDENEKEDIDRWDGFAKPLFSFQKYYPLINEVVLIISSTSKDYLEDRRNVHDYYFPVLNLWNHPHHNTLPAVQNYQDLTEEEQSELYKSEEYTQAGLLRRVLDDELDVNIPLGDYFKEQLNIHPLLPYEGDHILEGRFGNSIRFGATARADEKIIPEQNKNNWSNGAKGENGDPITIIRNGQSVALDNQGWIHATEDINLDPSSIYLTSNQKIDNFIIASDAWHTFGINASVPQNDQNEAQNLIDEPAEFIQDKEIEVDKIEQPKDNQEEINQGQQGQQQEQQEQQETGSIDYAKQDQEASGSLATSGSLDAQTSGSISEEEAGLTDEEDTIEYYQLDDGQTEPEAIERPPLPESYVLASGENKCTNCKFHQDNQCNKWGAKVRGKHEQPWVCDAWEAKPAKPAWTKLPNSTRKIRRGQTTSIYKYQTRTATDLVTYYHLVASTEEGIGELDERGFANSSKIKSDLGDNYLTNFPFKYVGGLTQDFVGFNAASGKTVNEYYDGVKMFTRLRSEGDVIDVLYEGGNYGRYGDDKSTWPYTLLNQQIFDPEENYERPLYVEAKMSSRTFDKDTTAGRQVLTSKAKEAFIKRLKKIDPELVGEFDITLDDGYFKKFVDEGSKTVLTCSFKMINLVDKGNTHYVEY
jgi:hypothetical protein